MMHMAELPLPPVKAEIASWPSLCVAEVWQPIQPKPASLMPRYKLRLFGAREWQTLWPIITKLGGNDRAARPVAITRYEASGRSVHLLLQLIAMGLPQRRLYACDGFVPAHGFIEDKPRQLPLLYGYDRQLAEEWARLRRFWQQHAERGPQGLGLVLLDRTTIIAQPVGLGSRCIDRNLWMHEVHGGNKISSGSEAAFRALAPAQEHDLVSRITGRATTAGALLNPGLIAMAKRRMVKDRFAPKTPVSGICHAPSRPHLRQLAIIEPKAARV